MSYSPHAHLRAGRRRRDDRSAARRRQPRRPPRRESRRPFAFDFRPQRRRSRGEIGFHRRLGRLPQRRGRAVQQRVDLRHRDGVFALLLVGLLAGERIGLFLFEPLRFEPGLFFAPGLLGLGPLRLSFHLPDAHAPGFDSTPLGRIYAKKVTEPGEHEHARGKPGVERRFRFARAISGGAGSAVARRPRFSGDSRSSSAG